MIELTVSQIEAAVDGEPALPREVDEIAVTSVVTDSRQVARGALFVAIRGEHVDGHDYTADAFVSGAVCALVEQPVEGPHIVVPDSVAALGRVARATVDHSDATVIGITGSSGKTTAKDLLAQVLARRGETVAPVGSFNNEIGLPLTVCRVTPTTRHLVLEMSARDVGHLSYLTDIAPPHVAVVLNVGVAHIGIFGSRERIAEAKGELVEALPGDGLAVLNGDDPYVAAMAARTTARVVRYGDASGSDYRASDVALDAAGRPSFTLHTPYGEAPVALQLVGAHMVGNALACAAVAGELGLPVADVAAALSEAAPVSRWRMEVRQTAAGVTVINDAYNANTESMIAALKALKAMAGGRRTWAVLGGMGELGDSAVDEHVRVGQLVVRLGIDRLVTVGPLAKVIYDTFLLEGSLPDDAVHVEDIEGAVAHLSGAVREGDVVLVKASRAAGLERVALALAPDEPGAAGAFPSRGGPA
jgi:UDP-N-acetylmuramoyl-tripeptide--D-alanyl-D-alanine ligase